MKAKLERDIRIRNRFLSEEINLMVRKATLQNVTLSRPLRQQVFFKSVIPIQSLRVRIHNHCILTGRSRSYVRFFRLSRIKLRELALKGSLFGVQKASW